MKKTKAWYTYLRNGVIYVQFKDKFTGEKLTARSTGTRDPTEALAIVHEWYYNPDSFFNKTIKTKSVELLKKILREALLTNDELKDVLKDFVSWNIKDVAGYYTPVAPTHRAGDAPPCSAQHPPEAHDVVRRIDTITLIDYLFLFWNYETSPYVRQLLRLGKKTPQPERFAANTWGLKKYAEILGGCLLATVTADEINTMLGTIKQKGDLMASSLSHIRQYIVQALRFAYQNKFLEHDITRDIPGMSTKSRKKEIFSNEELEKLFSPNENVFGDTTLLLLNKLLLVTGCRIGELQALKTGDVLKTKNGYQLRINKSYCNHGRRVKETKTAREDDVPISNEIAAELLEFITTNPFGADTNAFIFYSQREDVPLSYCAINKNFNATLKRLGIKRDNLTIHSYRHTYTSLLQDAGFSDIDLLYLTRHDDIRQVQRYSNHATPTKEKKKRKAAKIIGKMIA